MLVGLFVSTGAAQAETGAFWLIHAALLSEALLPTVEAETDLKWVLLTTLGGQEVDISCGTILLVEAHLVEPNGKILGKILLHGCDFLTLVGGSSILQKACEPFVKLTIGGKTVIDKGLIETEVITGLIKLHEKNPILVFTPPAGGLFATINLGEECAFGERLKVGNGENKTVKKVLEAQFALKDCEGKALTDSTKHLVEELKALTNLYVNGGETKAAIDGSAWASLRGAHFGLTFAAHAA